MDLDFTPEQELLRETVRGLCARHAGLDVVREMEDDPVGYPEKFWVALLDAGLSDPDLTMLDRAIVYQEFGRALAPSPHFVSTVLSAGVLDRAGNDDQRAEWLPKIAAGDAIVTPAWLEPDRGFGEAGVALHAEIADGHWRLTGTKRHVAYAGSADRLLVLARHHDGVSLFLVDPAGEGVTLTQQKTVASDTQYRVDFDRAPVDTTALVGTAGYGWIAWNETMYDALVLLAAWATGAARYALDITVQYAKDRHQFDKPLGAFQAIAHYLADAVTALDGAETLVWEAAWAHTEGRPLTRLAPMAKLFASQTFRDITAMAQQVFGGVGFTVEYDIQLYFRRAKQLQIGWWNDRYLEELIAADVLDG